MKSPVPKPRSLDAILAGYLYLVAGACAFAAAVYLGSGPDGVRRSIPGMTNPMFVGLVCAWVAGVVCALSLKRSKKWAFWGLLLSNIGAFVINGSLRGFTEPNVWLGLLAVLLLWLLLRAGGKNSAWRKLR